MNYMYLLVILIIFLIIFLYWYDKKSHNLPPGPIGLPIVGYLPFFSKEPFKDLFVLGKCYGNIFSLSFGQTLVVVLNDFTSVKEAFSKSTTIDKYQHLFTYVPDGVGFGGINGNEWVEQRRYCMRKVKELGLGTSKWEQQVQEEVDDFMKQLAEFEGQPVDINKMLTPSVSNNISSLILGKRFPRGHPERNLLDQSTNAVFQAFNQVGARNFFPRLFHFMSKLGLMNSSKGLKDIIAFNTYVKRLVENRKETIDASQESEVFIDDYLNQIRRSKEFNLKTWFNDETLYGNIQGLFTAGSETIKTSLNWLFLGMAKFQDVQDKVFQEINEVLGREGKILWLERAKLPYTCAVILEAQRWRTIAPVNPARVAMEDITIGQYDVPKGTNIIANLWAVHNDSNYWKNPENFVPERFLSEDGSQVNWKPDSFIPFSYGARNCPGNIVALIEILLYFTSLIQRFKVLPPEGQQPNFDGCLGLTYQSKDQKLYFLPRDL